MPRGAVCVRHGNQESGISREVSQAFTTPKSGKAHIGSVATSEQALLVSQVVAAILDSADNVSPKSKNLLSRKPLGHEPSSHARFVDSH